MKRVYGALLGLVLVLGSPFAGSEVSAQEPTPNPTDPFVVPAVLPEPVPTFDEVTSCSGESCNGTDPLRTGCATPVGNDPYTQTSVEVYDKRGPNEVLLGTLSLRANHLSCNSTQWPAFHDLTIPLTFDLRIVQNNTGVNTEWERFYQRREDVASAQFHSPVERMRAELIVYDHLGNVAASVVTDSY